MTTKTNDPAKAAANVDFIRNLLEGAKVKMSEAGELQNMALEDYPEYDEETMFYCCGREFRGYAGIREFLAPIADYKQVLLDIIDIFASDERICLVINEQSERVSDGKQFDFVRNVIYKVVDGKITECWIGDTPYAWGLKEYQDTIVAGA